MIEVHDPCLQVFLFFWFFYKIFLHIWGHLILSIESSPAHSNTNYGFL